MRLMVLFLLVTLLSSCKVFKVPEYKDFRNLKISRIGLKESTMTMELVYHNPNKFAFDIKKSDLDIYVDGLYLGKSVSDSLIHVDKKSDFILPVSLRTDMKNIIKNAWNMLSHKSVLVQAKGTVNAGTIGFFKTFNVDYEGRHELSLMD